MQIDPWGSSRGAREIDFCGRPATFQTGPFVIAATTRAPLVPVFTVRTGVRHYQMRTAGRFDPRTAADVTIAFEATIRFYERLVREEPSQWMVFDDVWPPREAPVTAGGTREESRPPLRRPPGPAATRGAAG